MLKRNINVFDNFIKLCNSGFYDGSPVHRIVEYVLIQMGMPANSTETDAGKRTKDALDKANKKVQQLNRQLDADMKKQLDLEQQLKDAAAAENELTGIRA